VTPAGVRSGERAFVDTNVLVYAYDASEPRKRDIARALVIDHLGAGTLCLSTQVLSEFFSVVTTKGELTLPPQVASWFIEQLGAAHLVTPSHATLAAAARRSATRGHTIWDALIVEAALECGADLLYTEDAGLLHRVSEESRDDSAKGGRLRAIDPFAEA